MSRRSEIFLAGMMIDDKAGNTLMFRADEDGALKVVIDTVDGLRTTIFDAEVMRGEIDDLEWFVGLLKGKLNEQEPQRP